MMIYQATGDLRKVSLWLGHAQMQTTEIYLRADPVEKIEIIEAVTPPSLRRGRFTVPTSSLRRCAEHDYAKHSRPDSAPEPASIASTFHNAALSRMM
jgi:hypothetical protein